MPMGPENMIEQSGLQPTKLNLGIHIEKSANCPISTPVTSHDGGLICDHHGKKFAILQVHGLERHNLFDKDIWFSWASMKLHIIFTCERYMHPTMHHFKMYFMVI